MVDCGGATGGVMYVDSPINGTSWEWPYDGLGKGTWVESSPRGKS